MESDCQKGLAAAADRARGSSRGAVVILGSLADTALSILNPAFLTSQPPAKQQRLLRVVAMDCYAADELLALQDLERYQHECLGLEPPAALSVHDLKTVASLLRRSAATTLPAGGGGLSEAVLDQEVRKADQLLDQLLPGDASLLLRRALAHPMISPEGVQACQAALRAARAEHAHLLAAAAVLSLAYWHMAGACGDWSVEEVQPLIADSAAELEYCKPWLAKLGCRFHTRQLEFAQQIVERTVARLPGIDRLPAAVTTGELGAMVQAWQEDLERPKCSGCGEQAADLRKCSRCRVAAYCSRECQVKHWREGGHRQECARLARAQQGS